MLTVVVKNRTILSFLVFAIGGRVTEERKTSYGEIIADIEGVKERYLIYDLFGVIKDFLYFKFSR